MAWEGALAVVPPECDGLYVSPEFAVFEIDQRQAEPRYLDFYFRRPSVWPELSGRSMGTNVRRRRLHPSTFLRYCLPLPPVLEQRRFVERIDALAAKLEEATRLRKDVISRVGLLAQAIITTMVSASPTFKPLAEMIEQGSTISYGVLVPGGDQSNGVPFVRIQDLHPDNPPILPSKRISPSIDAQYSRTRLRGNEVLVAVVGATIGKVGTVPQSWVGGNIARAVCRIIPGPHIKRDFLIAVLRSKRVQNYFHETTRTLAQPTLNVGQLEQTPIPILSLDEQEEVVGHLRRIESSLQAVRTLQKTTAEELDFMLPAILDRAFRGEL
jgi:type I restriction enzyme S subunit